MSARERNLCWDALVQATQANPAFTPGRIAAALKAIREAARTEGILEEDLPREIEMRCSNYRKLWPGLTLTPTALAAHWFRVTAPMVSRPMSAKQATIAALRHPEHGNIQL